MTDTVPFRPRRSCLYMPGANARALEKAKTLDTDVVIIDLEDAVAPESKVAARLEVTKAVESKNYGNREVVVRVNSFDSEWGRADMVAAVSAEPDAILVPKIISAEDIYQLDAAISNIDSASQVQLWVMIEMPEAVLNIREIAAAARSTRLSAFVIGLNDLAKEMQAAFTPDRQAFQYALSTTLMAARAFGLVVIDAVFNDIKADAGFVQECEQGKVMGFDGKSLIHPSQLEVANKIYSPSAEEIEHSQCVIDAFSLPENKNVGVLRVNGKMTERLHLEQAERIVAIAKKI